MLVLTRQPGDSLRSTIVITDRDGTLIEVRVARIDYNGTVHLHVNAPREVRVDRTEVRAQREQEVRDQEVRDQEVREQGR